MTNLEKILVVCQGIALPNGKHLCYKVKRQGVYRELGKEIYVSLIEQARSQNYSISHGLCPECKDKTYELMGIAKHS